MFIWRCKNYYAQASLNYQRTHYNGSVDTITDIIYGQNVEGNNYYECVPLYAL